MTTITEDLRGPGDTPTDVKFAVYTLVDDRGPRVAYIDGETLVGDQPRRVRPDADSQTTVELERVDLMIPTGLRWELVLELPKGVKTDPRYLNVDADGTFRVDQKLSAAPASVIDPGMIQSAADQLVAAMAEDVAELAADQVAEALAADPEFTGAYAQIAAANVVDAEAWGEALDLPTTYVSLADGTEASPQDVAGAKKFNHVALATAAFKHRPHADITHVDFGAEEGADSTTAIQDAVDAAGTGGAVYVPSVDDAFYLTEPIVLVGGQRFGGMACGATGWKAARIQADPTFTGDALIQTNTWTVGDWWHYGVIHDLLLECDGVADRGIAIHQMGESSSIEHVAVRNAAGFCGIDLTGSHAPATLYDVTVGNTDGSASYGVALRAHPAGGALAAAGNAGVVRIFGLSGDYNDALVYSNGAHKVSALGLKAEHCPKVVHIEGASAGGSAAQWLISGYGNDGDDGVYIGGTAAPILSLIGFGLASFTNYVNDTVATKTLPVSGWMSFLPARIEWNGSIETSYGNGTLTLGPEKAIRLRRPSVPTTTTNALLWNTADQLIMQAGASAGIVLRSADTTFRVHANNTGVAFNGQTPAARPDYTVTNHATDRSYDANATTLDELADIVGTLIADLIAIGLLQ